MRAQQIQEAHAKAQTTSWIRRISILDSSNCYQIQQFVLSNFIIQGACVCMCMSETKWIK